MTSSRAEPAAPTARTSRRLTRSLLSAIALAGALACGGTPQAPATQPHQRASSADQKSSADHTSAPRPDDTRTPIEKRRDAACDNVAAKLTACALEDAKADLAAGKTSKADFDADTAPDILRANTEKYAQACKSKPMSTRQVRVLEVCYQEEPRCDPLLDCLKHLNDRTTKSNAKP